MNTLRRVSCIALLLVTFPAFGAAQEAAPDTLAVDLQLRYRVAANVTYLTANGMDLKLDVYTPRSTNLPPNATIVFIHGGGWVQGNKDGATLTLLPYLAMGLSVVNVQYRLARVSPAPAAVEDCRCALRWVVRNAKTYNLDPNRIVIAGPSAGGHLALTTGMLGASSEFDRPCAGAPVEPKVAAIVNWFGITDVADLLDGPNKKPFPENWPYAVEWLGNAPNRDDLARRVSPLTYVRPGLPPILTIHGDKDPLVPYQHAVRLHEALKKAGVPNEFLTIPGGSHGNFTREETLKAYAAIRVFLTKHGVLRTTTTSSAAR